MLTADLVINEFKRKGRILTAVPDCLNRQEHGYYLPVVESALNIYASGKGEPRDNLHRKVEKLFLQVEDCPPRRIRAFCKLLDDASVYNTDKGAQSAELRLRVFSMAAEYHPLVDNKEFMFDNSSAEIKKFISEKMDMKWPEIEQKLYQDVIGQQPLMNFNNFESPEDFLSHYNVSQIQGTLYRAVSMIITVKEDFKQVIRGIKLCGLLHQIKRTGKDTYEIKVDGPSSVLRETRRYGVSMAGFIPFILKTGSWWIQARLKTPWGMPALYELSSTEGFGRNKIPVPEFDSRVEEHFDRKFKAIYSGWRVIREGGILADRQKVFIPDFLLRHEDGIEIHLEIVGFWTPEYLEQKRKTLAQFRDKRIILAVWKGHLKDKESLPAGVISYSTVVKAEEVLAAVEEIRAQMYKAGEVKHIALRDYQKESLQEIAARYKDGVTRQLICLPTGTGKTVIFSEFPGFLKMKKRMLVLAHRKELLDQAKEKIIRVAPHLKVEIEQGQSKASDDADVIVASVPTLGRKDSERLAKLDPEQFFIIVVDEAHHATAETYRRIFNYFKLYDEGSRRLLIGFTATPRRGDGQGLGQVFQKITMSRNLPEMIEQGYLSPIIGYRVETTVDLRGVKSRMGDFVVSQLAESVNIKSRNELVIDVFKKHLKTRKTICFCVDVEHASALAEEFRSSGIAADTVNGSMQTDKRVEVLEKFRKGEISVLTNCMVLTEGYDEPSVEGIILARPTRSTLLYTQMIGRGTRLHPGKSDLAVIDIVDITKEHTLATLPKLFGLSDFFDMEGNTAEKVKEAIEWVTENRPWVNIEEVDSLSDLRYRCKMINPADLRVPEEIEDYTEFAWFKTGTGSYRLSLANHISLSVTSTIMSRWDVMLNKAGKEKNLFTVNDLPVAMARSEDYVSEHFNNDLGLILRNSRWRKKPASDKQKNILKTRKITVPDNMTMGQASHVIGALFSS
ncbi:MAG: DUF790 family protein [Planctomycetota bacterium]